MFDYIFKNNHKETQLIVSTLGFDEKDYKGIELKKIIELDNDKYQLLNKEDYERNEGIFRIMFND